MHILSVATPPPPHPPPVVNSALAPTGHQAVILATPLSNASFYPINIKSQIGKVCSYRFYLCVGVGVGVDPPSEAYWGLQTPETPPGTAPVYHRRLTVGNRLHSAARSTISHRPDDIIYSLHRADTGLQNSHFGSVRRGHYTKHIFDICNRTIIYCCGL